MSEVILGVDDDLLKEKFQIPRDDVAEVCVNASLEPAAVNRSIDIITKEITADTKPTKNWKNFFESNRANCSYDR